MRLKASHTILAVIFVLLCVLQCEFAVGYKTEIEITPAPPEEETTKKSGFFSGIKNFFRGSPSTTTTPLPLLTGSKAAVVPNATPHPNPLVPQTISQTPAAGAAQRPPPLALPHAPLMPLGPRPDTPPSTPLAGSPQQPPQWPQPQQGPTQTPGIKPQHLPQNPQMSSAPGATPVGSGSPGAAFGAGSGSFGGSTFGAGGVRPGATQSNYPAGLDAGSARPGATQANFPAGFGARPGATQSNYPAGFGAGSARPGSTQSNFPSGIAPYHPPKAQPSGFDLSYGGGAAGGTRPHGERPGFGLSPMTSSTSTTTTTTTTTTPKSAQPFSPMDFDLRGGFGSSTTTTTLRPQTPKEEFPPLPSPRRPSTGAKEDFPPLPTPRSSSPTPASPLRPSSPSVWGSSTPASAFRPQAPSGTPTMPTSPGTADSAGSPGVSFVPHAPTDQRTTTRRPGAGAHSATDSNSVATDDEIRALTETLYTKEQSLLNFLQVNPQGKTRSIDSADEAPLPLLEVDPKVLETPTVAKMRLLFNNYEDDTLTNEYVTPNERKEENDFVDAVMSTQVMRQAMLFLQNKGIVSPDPKTHRDLVKELWFTQYSRGSGRIGSSGFEHVFVHEVKNGTLIGLHNWVYFADEEKAGSLDYKGYLKQIDLGNKAKVLKLRFTHKGVNKPVNGLFIGTTPELELALYTICFQLRPDRSCHVSLGNSQFDIVTYTWRYRGKHLIGSAFPEI